MLCNASVTHHTGVVNPEEDDGAADEVGPVTLQYRLCTVYTIDLRDKRVLDTYPLSLKYISVWRYQFNLLNKLHT